MQELFYVKIAPLSSFLHLVFAAAEMCDAFSVVVDHYIGEHKWLLSEEVDLLSSLLLPLAGPEQYTEEEVAQLPLDLQYLPEDKQREPDPDIRKVLLEALLKVCTLFQLPLCLLHSSLYIYTYQGFI